MAGRHACHALEEFDEDILAGAGDIIDVSPWGGHAHGDVSLIVLVHALAERRNPQRAILLRQGPYSRDRCLLP